MACIDTQTLQDSLVEALDKFMHQHAVSCESVDAASETTHSLSLALNKIKLYTREELRPPDIINQLRDSLDWINLNKFMEAQRLKRPYPLFLHRAHMYGELFPRFIDCMTERYCDSFGSDDHIFQEWEGESEISEPIIGMEEALPSVAELAEEVGKHLLKTQINRRKTARHKLYYFSPFISLSGDMTWTLHTSFRKYRDQKPEQESGLAIFDAKILLERGTQISRVSDLLLFLDKEPRYGSSAITELARYWARNADEYICWDMIPKEALVKFVSCNSMTDGLASEKMFLRSEFRKSKSLAIFKKETPVSIAIEDYTQRISLFLCDIMDEVSPNTNGDHLIEYLFTNLADPFSWGYKVNGDTSFLRRKLLAVVMAEYARGIGSWMFNDKFSISLQRCLDLHEDYLFKANRELIQLSNGH